MKRRIWTLGAALASIAALVAVPSAYAAYTTAKLEVRQSGTAVTVRATLSPDDDPTASVRIFAPSGAQITTTQAPGTALGSVRAVVKALDLGGADLPLEGQLVVAAPGQVPAASQAACLGTLTPTTTWLMTLGAAGQTLTVPTYLIATAGNPLGAGYIQVCLPPPDVPAGTPGRATFGAKLYSAELTINGVFGATANATWLSFWTPYRPSVGQVNAAGTVASPAQVAGGTLTIAARRLGNRRSTRATVSGTLTQGGQPRAGVTVVVRGGPRANALRRLGSARTAANGSWRLQVRSGTFFRANATAAAGTAPALCTAIAAAIAPVTCVNPTTSGFTAQSRVVRKR
jgi:hypothetical protein